MKYSKKWFIIVSLVLIILINSVYSLEPGKLYINNVFIPFEVKAVEQEKTKSTFYIYGNGQRIAKKENNELYYFYNDHLGSPRAISDDQGNIVWKADYLPFGEVFNELNSDNKINYNSKEKDIDTKLIYYGQRYYPANIGRFITADKIFGNIINPQSLNKYVYTLNNPLKYIDPMGYQEIETDSLHNFIRYAIQENRIDVIRQMLREFFDTKIVRNMVNYALKQKTIGIDRINTADTLMFTADSMSVVYPNGLQENAIAQYIYPDTIKIEFDDIETTLDLKLIAFHENVHKFYLTGAKSKKDYSRVIEYEIMKQKIGEKKADEYLLSNLRICKEYLVQLKKLEMIAYDTQLGLIWSIKVNKLFDSEVTYKHYRDKYRYLRRLKEFELDKKIQEVEYLLKIRK